MISGSLLVEWTVRLSLVLYFIVAVALLRSNSHSTLGLPLKLLWTSSFLLCLLHVLAAFHFVHHWHHSEAFNATAKETTEKVGFEFGPGVYFNYLFLVVWAIDVVFTWIPLSKHPSFMRWLMASGRWYLGFIVFNSLVVFESGWLRLLGILATLVLGALFTHRMMNTKAAKTR